VESLQVLFSCAFSTAGRASMGSYFMLQIIILSPPFLNTNRKFAGVLREREREGGVREGGERGSSSCCVYTCRLAYVAIKKGTMCWAEWLLLQIGLFAIMKIEQLRHVFFDSIKK
jgi:hypothetical protein